MLSIDTNSFAKAIIVMGELLRGMKVHEKFKVIIDYDPQRKKTYVEFLGADDARNGASIGDSH